MRAFGRRRCQACRHDRDTHAVLDVGPRIASYATANQVLVDDQTTLASTDADLAFDEIGPVELKGVAQPVRLSEARRLT